jgi:hypothetical protein
MSQAALGVPPSETYCHDPVNQSAEKVPFGVFT